MALSDRMYVPSKTSYSRSYDVKNKNVWPGYLVSQEEKQQIDRMMGRALFDQKFCDRLIRSRDEMLFAEYRLSQDTQRWLCSIEARSLTELAEAISFN